MSVNVRGAIAHLAAQSEQGKKQLTFATRLALTRTGQMVKEAQEREIRDVFSSPTPYTLSSLYLRPATANNLTAEVKLKDFAGKGTPASRFLSAQVIGGQRAQKRFERALQSVGAMPPGYRAVPASGAKMDSYGNMDRGQIVQILAFFRAFPEAGYKANMTDKSRTKLARGSKTKQGFAYFAGRPGDRLPLGIYQRVVFARGTAIRPVMIFVRSAIYQPVFDFQYVAKKTIDAEFDKQFQLAFEEAMRTAR